MVHHGLPFSKHHGILPWFICFKKPWYAIMFSMVCHGMISIEKNRAHFRIDVDGPRTLATRWVPDSIFESDKTRFESYRPGVVVAVSA